MKTPKYLNRATDFGSLSHQNDFISFTIKIFIYIIPATLLGDFIDKSIVTMEEKEVLGGDTHALYILLQTFVNISILYLFILFLPDFLKEFQSTMPGVYFITLYFTMQTNYMNSIKEYMKFII